MVIRSISKNVSAIVSKVVSGIIQTETPVVDPGGSDAGQFNFNDAVSSGHVATLVL